MKFIISKEKYYSVCKQLLKIHIGELYFGGGSKLDDDITLTKVMTKRTSKTAKRYNYIELYDSNKENIIDIYLKGSTSVPKKCKKYIELESFFITNIESYVPILRKKEFAKVIIDYVYEQTKIKVDCVKYHYNNEWTVDDDGDTMLGSRKVYSYRK